MIGIYFKVIRRIMDTAILDCVRKYKMTREEVLVRIANQIDSTSAEHRKPIPNIQYADPFCRLGYVYRHAAAQASLFEWVIGASADIKKLMESRSQGSLHICSMGGGPGTELLGVSKGLLVSEELSLSKIEFNIIDGVQAWAENWQQLANAVNDEFQARGITRFGIDKSFLSFDVLEASSYENYPSYFGQADLVVCNYLFSENKTKVVESREMWNTLRQVTPNDCVYVVIDRNESNPQFVNTVRELFESVFGKSVEVNYFNRALDSSEEANDLGQELLSTLKFPRLKFSLNGRPTAFWFTVKQG